MDPLKFSILPKDGETITEEELLKIGEVLRNIKEIGPRTVTVYGRLAIEVKIENPIGTAEKIREILKNSSDRISDVYLIDHDDDEESMLQ